MRNRYLEFPRKFCRVHVPKIQNSVQFLKTTVYSTGGKQLACHLLEQQKQNNYTKYISIHTPSSIHTYVFFNCISCLSTCQRSQMEGASNAKRSGSAVQIQFWELQAFQSFGQTTFHTTKQVRSLRGQNNGIFESATVLPCLSTGAAAALPAQQAASIRLPPATSLPSITSQQAGEETLTLHLCHKLHTSACATRRSSSGRGRAC